MDAAWKDGVVRHVMSGINPQECQVSSFKHPNAVEQKHDFFYGAPAKHYLNEGILVYLIVRIMKKR
jgi:polyphosphate kinase 2 (PPK2 family)